ncbi:hypothetical protein CBR_g11211 [Chara braunii]|uniref:Uncharacterized protein n=1 Tax=Chara braunii TaxID=69332 RepID=A0A388KQS5_CHABU|nr:hypothetical protein CBR_g11211 [Chara braunii]|eukprot:GBG72283.1 hypothetical protein CBR_g11211 [Chara braunii]
MARTKHQPGLGRQSPSETSRDVVASGFEQSGGSSASVHGGHGGNKSVLATADPPLTCGLREASIIFEEPQAGRRPDLSRPVAGDRRQEGETSGADGLAMPHESRRHDDIAAASQQVVRGKGREILHDDDTDPRLQNAPRTGEDADYVHQGRHTDELRGTGGSNRGGTGTVDYFVHYVFFSVFRLFKCWTLGCHLLGGCCTL